MGKLGAFKQYTRKNFTKRKVEERVKDYDEVYISLEDSELAEQASRCMSCGIAFCNWGCPLGNLVPDWNDMVYNENWKKAYKRLSLTNNFPEFTGRLCPAPCEGACTLGINRKAVCIRDIELSIIERAFKEGFIRAKHPKIRTNKKIAVIGSGPAGLAASAQLNSVGHTVTVFERAQKIGGLLRYGIPDFKLEKNIIDRRINLLIEEGVRFETSINVGVDIKVDTLLKDFDAIILTGGSTISRDLNIEGRELTGVHFAVEYLTMQNKNNSGENVEKQISAKDKVVVVIGGGDTGSDCVGTAIRQGAKQVIQLEIMPKPPVDRDITMPWPTYPFTLKTTTSHEEGCTREWCVSTKKITGEKGEVKKLHCVRVQWVTDESGQRHMSEIEGSEFVIEADLIILAMGFLHTQHEGLIRDFGLTLDVRGNVCADSNYATNINKVFAAGDLRSGQSLIVKAIKEGRCVAKNVDMMLMGETFLK
ncbi:glutamate synthase subunit beta [Clostridium sp.]|uniref:glutamate synthase subunit beta n=1 Tax=Clostridium sp. TaxID=1506 RepID=UPI001A545EC6|nr:glutamate synthase subunit beta [Clostridium sp.]MBK5241757.1 glutamate synthase subunit beta [Clostridium sp.]